MPNISKLVGSKPLQRGSKDRAAVTALQKALRAMGFTLEADGFFGGETETIIEALQRDHGLKVDGVVGPATAAIIDGAGSPAVPPLPSPPRSPAVRPGSSPRSDGSAPRSSPDRATVRSS